jgi:hypothetical protein
VGPCFIVVDAPGFDTTLRIGQIGELGGVEQLITELPVERLDVAVIRGLAGPR